MSVIRFTTVLALIGGLGLPLAAGAQTPPPAPTASAAPGAAGHHGRHHRQSFLHALRSLNLTPTQQQQVTAFRDEEKKANLNADADTKRANAKKLRDEIMGILTPDQKAQLSAERHRPRVAQPGAPAPAPAASPSAQ